MLGTKVISGEELKPMWNDKASSFYGKAIVFENESGEKILQSYDKEVCKITRDGEFVRIWPGYSATTMRHVNSFLDFVGIEGGGKTWWETQPVAQQ